MKWLHNGGHLVFAYTIAGVGFTCFSAYRGQQGKPTWQPSANAAASLAANIFAWPVGVVQTIRLSKTVTK